MTNPHATARQTRSGPTCWIVTDGAVGNEKQCQALNYYLGFDSEVFRIRLRWPWRLLAPRGLTGAAMAVNGPLAGRLAGPWPNLLITCGRQAALVSRLIRRQSGGHTSTVHILNPRISPTHFDAVICPRHDGISGANVIVTDGALHCVDESSLQQFRGAWPQLDTLPQPRVAVLIGATNGAYRVDNAYLGGLLERAAALAGSGSLLVSTSYRTPLAQREFVATWFGQRPGRLWTGGPEADNPYSGFLGWADRFVVSADSVNMISEALGTGKPVHSQSPAAGSRRFARFYQRLAASGRLLELDAPAVAADYPPLRETGAVAGQLRRLLQF